MTWPADSHIIQPGDIRRLSDQNQRVLARLERGPATRHELQAIASNITGRISDLRAAGYDIPKPVHSLYRLKKHQESATDERTTTLRASEPSGESEVQDLRAGIQNAPHDCNEWTLR